MLQSTLVLETSLIQKYLHFNVNIIEQDAFFSELVFCILHLFEQFSITSDADLNRSFRFNLLALVAARCDVTNVHSEVAQKAEDYLWLKLCQVAQRLVLKLACLFVFTR